MIRLTMVDMNRDESAAAVAPFFFFCLSYRARRKACNAEHTHGAGGYVLPLSYKERSRQ